MSQVIDTFRARIARARVRQTFANLIQGMILSDLRDTSQGTTFDKVLTDEFSYTEKDGKGQDTEVWFAPKSTLVRWANAGCAAIVLGYSLDDEDEFITPAQYAEFSDTPTVKALAEVYTLIERGRKSEDADIRSAWFDKARGAWIKALKRKSPKRFDLRVQAEVDKVLGKVRKPKDEDGNGNDGNDGNDSSGVGSGADLNASENVHQVTMLDLATVRQVLPMVEDQIKLAADSLHISQVKVRACWADALRFANEHGSQVVAACIASDVSDVLAAADAVQDEDADENDENDENDS